MAFLDRMAQSNQVISIVHKRVWSVKLVSDRVALIDYGAALYVPDDLRQAMRSDQSRTAKHIRFTPDYIVIDRARPSTVYLLDYKATETPLYSSNRIRSIATEAKMPALRWQDIGQMEADAFDNYLALHAAGARVAVLNYCAYGEPTLMCEYIDRIRVLHRDQVRLATETGSRTPFVNFYLKSLRPLDTFIREVHGITVEPQNYAEALKELQTTLPIKHSAGSPYARRP